MPEDRAALLAEAYKRGILPPDMKSAYEEAQKRGILSQPEESSVLGDVVKSGASGLAKGLIGGTVALPGNIADLVGRGADWAAEKITGEKPASAGKRAPLTSEFFEKQIEGATGRQFHKPQTTAGEYVQTAVEFLGDPTSYVGGGGVLRKVGGALTGALGSETAGQVARKVSPENEGLARIAGGVAGGKLSNPRALKAASAEAPTIEELKTAHQDAYAEIADMNVPIAGHVTRQLGADIKAELALPKNAMYPGGDQPSTFRQLDRLQGGPIVKGLPPPHSSSSELYSVRTALNHIVGDKPGTSDAKAAKIAIEMIDQRLEQIPDFAETAKRARGNYRAAKQSERITGAEERGELNAASSGSGANMDNALRQRIKGLYLDPKVPKTPEEAALMKDIAMGSTPINLARLFSKLGPKHPLTGWGTALAADLTHGGGLATVTLAIGAMAQYMAERGTSGKIKKLDEMARANSPLGQAAGAGAPAQQAQPLRVTVPWGEVRGGLGAVPGALEAGQGSPLAQGNGP